MSDDLNSIKEYKGILGQVTSPLIFFALALLVIEGIIGITVVKSKLDAIQQFYMILVMAFLFLAVCRPRCMDYCEISLELNG